MDALSSGAAPVFIDCFVCAARRQIHIRIWIEKKRVFHSFFVGRRRRRREMRE